MEKDIVELKGVVADLKSANAKLSEENANLTNLKQETDANIRKLENTMSNKVDVLQNQRYEDQEILMGLQYDFENSMPEKMNFLAMKHEALENSVNSIEINTEKMQCKMKQDEKLLDGLEQQLKSRNVVVFGIPESNNDHGIHDKVVTLAKDVLGIQSMKNSDIEMTHRLGKPQNIEDQPRKLLIKFRSKKARDEFYKLRKKTPMHEDNSKNIYINEDLTKYRGKLFHDARIFVKTRKLHSCWTQNGNVMVKSTSDDKPTAVYDHEELRDKCNRILDAENAETSNSSDDSSDIE